jgi:hypothetical protein
MMRLVDTDRVAVTGSAAKRAWRPGGVRCARLWVLVCVVAWLVAALPASARAADVVYWANGGNNTISFARLDGSGGGDLPTTGATVAGPRGVALDPAAGRIYWANTGNNTISFAGLDGSGGGGDLATTGATLTRPIGVALDPAAARIYWTNDDATGNQLSFARLDGSGGGDLPTTGATARSPAGPPARRSRGASRSSSRPGRSGSPRAPGKRSSWRCPGRCGDRSSARASSRFGWPPRSPTPPATPVP